VIYADSWVAELPAEPTALLNAWVQTYANTDQLSHDKVEMRLFALWLKAVGVLGYNPAGFQRPARAPKE
jgi:hypothetical protein